MVIDYYNLKEPPFGVTPDSRYLYLSATHREALASILYGVEVGRGFVALIAKPGMGKTTLLFQALNELKDRATTVFLYQTIGTPVDFLRALLNDLGVHDAQSGIIELQSKLNEAVTQQSQAGKPLIVVIDEAQALDDSVLEMVRMLSNFETSREKLIQIVLSGQPQLADKLASPELVQLRQRVSIFACLKPFSPEEAALYIEHRLRIAGYDNQSPLFTKGALELIAEGSAGIPRNINNLCFNAMSLGCALKRRAIDCDIVRDVMADLDLELLRERRQIKQQPEDAIPRAAASNSAVSAWSVLKGWRPKLALACAVLVVSTGVLLQNHRRISAKNTARANDGMPPLAVLSERPPSGEPMPQAGNAGSVRVTAGQTIYSICVQNFGSCNPERLREIQTLNPWLSDLNHIEPGQNIRIPVVMGDLAPTQVLAEQSENSLSTKRAAQ